MKRQAATSKGLKKRLHDLQLNKVNDPRLQKKIIHPLYTILSSLVISMVTRARSLRNVEMRTAQIKPEEKICIALDGRIADNTFGNIIQRLNGEDLIGSLQGMVKAEIRRGNLQPTALRTNTIAIDGKNVAVLRWHDLLRVLKLKHEEASIEDVRSMLEEKYPHLQLCVPDNGLPYALARVHTVTLISSDAALCIHQRPIEGHTNEIGAMPALLEELKQSYGRTSLIDIVTTDSGNTSLATAGIIADNKWNYFSQIKSEKGKIYNEAVSSLGWQDEAEAESIFEDRQKGQNIIYHLWRESLSSQGCYDWTHARQLIRIQRTVEDLKTGEVTIGNRYYVTNKKANELRAKGCLKVSRAHWRCENETHWTADAEMQEDQRRLAWSRHPIGVFVVSLLKRIAVNILALARKLSRIPYSKETPSWHQVVEHFQMAMLQSILDTERFDTGI